MNTPAPTVRTVAISRIGDPAISRRSIARSVCSGTTWPAEFDAVESPAFNSSPNDAPVFR